MTTKNKMEIRKASIADKEQIVNIFAEEYAKPPYNEEWKKEVATKRIDNYFKDHEIFVIEIKDKLIGFAIITEYVWFTGLRGLLHELVISEDYQGKGYGKKLIQHVEEYFKKKGAKSISLMASPKSKAFQIYKRLKYQEEDFVSMYKELE
jgi:ribosomal protein S18 acetylase RimI-like enzyme